MKRTCCSIVLAATAVVLSSSATTQAERPRAIASQFAESPWSCHPQKFAASGVSEEHGTWTGLLPYKGPPVKYYARLSGSAVRCNGQTRISYRVYIDASKLPGNRRVVYFLQSAGVHKKWRNACVKIYNSDQTTCSFFVKGGEAIPRFGARPIYQYRGDGVIRYVRIRTQGKETGGGTSDAPAGWPSTITVRLSSYRLQPQATW